MKKQINTLKGLALMGVLMLSTTSTFAQDAPAEEKKSETKIGGYLDAYYKADFANRKDNGFAVVRVLGNDMNPTDILNMLTLLKKSSIDVDQLKPLQDLMK